MANKYTRRGQKQATEVVSADEFVSFWSRAYDFLLPHGQRILVGLGAAAVVVLASWIFTSPAAANFCSSSMMATAAATSAALLPLMIMPPTSGSASTSMDELGAGTLLSRWRGAGASA